MSEVVEPGRILFDDNGTRYVELFAEYPRYLNWGGSVEQKVAGFDGSGVALMVSGEESARIVLTKQEFAVLVASYQRYQADEEQRQAEVRARIQAAAAADDFDPFLDVE